MNDNFVNVNCIFSVKNNIYRDEIKIGLVLNTTTVLSGSAIFLQPDKTLMGLGEDVDPQRLLVPLALLAGAIVTLGLAHFFERKVTTFFSNFILEHKCDLRERMGHNKTITKDSRSITLPVNLHDFADIVIVVIISRSITIEKNHIISST